MKKQYLLASLAFISSAVAYSQKMEIIHESATDITIQHELLVNELENISIQNQNFIDFSANHKVINLKAGAPAIPFYHTTVQLPEKGKAVLRLLPSDFVEIPNVQVAPSKGNLKRNITPSSVAYSFGEEYTTNAFYPENIAVLNDPFIWRSVRGANVTFSPYQYNPVTKTLRVYKKINISVDYQENETGLNEMEVWQDPVYKPFQQDFVLNAKKEKYSTKSEEGEMLVIAPSTYTSSIQPLVDWKNQKGIKTTLVTTTETGTSTSAIKSYITSAYASNSNLVFVLLVGDHANIPAYSYGNSGGEQLFSDSYYGQISGSDYYPECLVGRFSGSTSEVSTMVTRTIAYEKSPAAGDWMEKAIGIGSDEGAGMGDDSEADWQHMRNIRTALMNFGYTTMYEFYDGSHGGADASGDPNSTIVSTAVNSGVGLFFYTGHGDQNSCVTSNYSSTNISAATNNGQFPFVVSVACNNGTFTSGTCISESWIRAAKNGSPTGALAAAGSSILMAWAPPMETQDEIANLIAATNTVGSKSKLGGLFYNGQLSMMQDYPGSEGEEVMQTWILFGDPSAQFRNKQTMVLNVTHLSNVPQTTTSVSVTCDVEGALVAISQNNILLGHGTVVDGTVTISIPSLSSDDPLVVTATKQNHVSSQTAIQVGSGAVGLSENTLEFNIYPVPSSGLLTIKGDELIDANLTIYSQLGQVVFAKESIEKQQVIDLSALDNGFYFVKIESIQGATIRKIEILK